MNKEVASGTILILLLFNILTFALNIHPALASGTIYIKADGNIDPPTAPIFRNGDLYTFIDDVNDSIVVERDNIIVDGDGYALIGNQVSKSRGIDLTARMNVTIRNMSITRFYYGIFLDSSTNNIIRGNNLVDNGWYDHGFGIYLISSSNNDISENDVTQDWVNGTAYGIMLEHSPDNTIRGNRITNCVYNMVLSSSFSNTLANNTMNTSIDGFVFPFNFAVFGSNLQEYVNYVDTSNTVSGKPIYYWVSKQGLTVPSDAGCVILANCTGTTARDLKLTGNFPSICLAYTTNCTITQNDVSMANAGILLYYSSNNVISKNKVSSHGGTAWTGGICLISSNKNVLFGNSIKEAMNYTIWHSEGGIWLESSSDNLVYENTVMTYHRGIFLNSSADNMIYHNNFINSTQQAYVVDSVSVWDDGYPSGGNYWSGYSGFDKKSGYYQNETGSDGIGDTPYVIDENNLDHYPLMNPCSTPWQLRVEWNRTYGTANQDWSTNLIQTRDGGYVMTGVWNLTTGSADSPGQGYSEIVKTDSLGNIQWSVSHPFPYGDYYPIAQTDDDGFLLGSTVNSTLGPDYDFCLAKLNAYGEPLWNRTYNRDWEILSSMVLLDDGGCLLAGITGNKTGGDLKTWCVRTDQYGIMQWNRTYDFLSRSIIQTSDAGFASAGIILPSISSFAISLFKIDRSGNVAWNKTYWKQESSEGGVVPSIIQTLDGGFLLSGMYMRYNDGYQDYSVVAIKTDRYGNMQWNTTYPDVGCGYSSAVQAWDGSYLIVGGTNSSQVPAFDAWLVRIDPYGNTISRWTYGESRGWDFGYALVAAADGGFAFAGTTNSSGAGQMDFWLVKLSSFDVQDYEPPVVRNVRHEPLYPMSNETIDFYAEVTDNVAVSKVQLNYTENGGTTWLLKDMLPSGGNTYSASLGPYSQQQVLSFCVIAYDTSGNMAYGSEIFPSLPKPPRVAPIVVSDESPNPLPDGSDVGYNPTEGGIDVHVNVTEIGIYVPSLWYNISYSLDGGLTWINQEMTYVGDFIWRYWVNATTNILFKIVSSDGSTQSKVYWIIVGPWEYPIYLYFSTAEQYVPVKGMDFDSDIDVSNNWASYETRPDYWKYDFVNNDIDEDGTSEVWSYAYMNPKTLDDGCLVIEYWIYYAFNNYPIITDPITGTKIIRDDHEHDFESVFIWVDLATGHIKKIACTQHKWVNHYIFDVNDPPKAINLAVENGGHGMALLTDQNKDGLPDVNILGSYIIQPGVNQFGGADVPMFFRDAGTINPNSFVARLYPWVIYDPRIPSSKLHLFDDPSILTNGLSLEAISPLLPSVVDEIPQYYGFLTDLLTVQCVLKTTYGAPLLGDSKLVFCVVAPLYRQEFREPGLLWRKVSFGWWLGKFAVKAIISSKVSVALKGYFEVAGAYQLLTGAAGDLTSRLTDKIINVLIDPAYCQVFDSQGRVLGYSSVANDLLGGQVLITRNVTNDLYDLFFILTNSTNDYSFQIRGDREGTYNMTISLTNTIGTEITFDVISIPLKKGSVHRYVVDWDSLESGGFGVEVSVDQDGDGVIEKSFLSDAKLTASEFEAETADTSPPFTATDYDGSWHTSDFTIHLTASDDDSAVAETYYRINNGRIQNVTAHGQPLIDVESASNTLEYWSVDINGNVESHHILTGIKLDKTAPIIQMPSREPADDVQPYQPVKVSVSATDAVGQVKNITLFCSTDNGTTWQPMPMNVNSSTGFYEVTISPQEAGTWVKYKITAFDTAENHAINDNAGQYYVYMTVPEFPHAVILPLFMALMLLAAVFVKRRFRHDRQSLPSASPKWDYD